MSIENYLDLCKISNKTKLAYIKDINDFISYVLRTSKNPKKVEEITKEDLLDYMTWLKNEYISLTYGMRKLSTLRVFFKYLHEVYNAPNYFDDKQNNLLSEAIDIAKFPIFCSKKQIDNLIQALKRNPDDFQVLRNQLIFTLLYNYGLSVNQVLELTFKNISLENRTISINKKSKIESKKLLDEDAVIIEKYEKLLSILYINNKNRYLFPVKHSLQVKPISMQAFWSILKKMFLENRSSNNIDSSNSDLTFDSLQVNTQHKDYVKKHPRA